VRLAGSSRGSSDGTGSLAAFSFPASVAVSPDATFALVAGMQCEFGTHAA
jgi:hypothetical protein